MACEVESEVESLLLYIDPVIRGYHVYRDVWEVSYIGEVLQCRDAHSHHDPFSGLLGQAAEISTLLKYLYRDIATPPVG